MTEHRNVPAGTLRDWEGVTRTLIRDYDTIRFPELLQLDLDELPHLREVLDEFERDALLSRAEDEVAEAEHRADFHNGGVCDCIGGRA